MKPHIPSILFGVSATASLLLLTSISQGPRTGITQVRTLTAEQEEILSHLSIRYLPDGYGNTNKTIRISGVNVQVVNGLGATNGYPPDPILVDPTMTQVNGLGNLIIGYDEDDAKAPYDRTGSHNLVLGIDNSYASFGGVISGRGNLLTGPCASVLAGEAGVAAGAMSAVVGGQGNTALGTVSSVGGGFARSAPNSFNWAAGSLSEAN